MSNEITREEKIAQNEQNIRTALEDYVRYINYDEPYDLDQISGRFVTRLATDNYESKHELREFFRKSPAWNEELDCLIINGNRTHDPDPHKCLMLTNEIIGLHRNYAEEITNRGVEPYAVAKMAQFLALKAKGQFAPDITPDEYSVSLEELVKAIPNAYAPGKKPSRVMGAIFKALGFVDNSAGSEYQKLFAQLADELNGKKISFKLFVSLNPAHFLTMSNPKSDSRGSTLTSCHSLNSSDYPYNNGCTGYARDNYSIIVFTAADPSEPETLNNRKTSRQMFFYRPGSGVLLQSRMYGTNGGIDGATEEGKVYRDLLQREISELENLPNLWKTSEYIGNKYDIKFYAGYGFGGYCDWTYEYMHPMLSIRSDVVEVVESGEFVPWEIGTFGLCPYCAEEHSEHFICDNCREPQYVCDCCGWGGNDEDDFAWVNGDRICRSCLDNYYSYCDHCEEYYRNEDTVEVRTRWGTEYWCQDCADNDANYCDECETWTTEDVHEARNRRGNFITVCQDCIEDHYCQCDDCGDYVHEELMVEAKNDEDDWWYVCPDCARSCDDCGEIFVRSLLHYRNGRCTCSACRQGSGDTEEAQEA